MKSARKISKRVRLLLGPHEFTMNFILTNEAEQIKLKIQTSPFVTLWTLERINDHGIDFVLIHARIGKDFIRMDGEIHTVNSLRCCCCKWEREWGKIQSKIFDFIYVENQKKLRLLFISRPTPWI